ncbi:uncharacterized protein HD556DRAFT_1447531 [Suillus plorans]|uniref:Uncharacterized protein n=1 Tax=Suillus plorans TaxID=116603 RepID=A0A9P7DDV0_9AGAM|nr:uncharacterized protein HD556DRAFT_1447531 [Suillus plorans]KAG1788875.1 hypothetical protein HD556DRAFT_1447531 [Suillus plorans]
MRDDITQLKAKLQSQQQNPQARQYTPNPPAYRPYPWQVGNITPTLTAQAQGQPTQQAVGQSNTNFVPVQQYQIPMFQPQPTTPSYQQPPVTPGPNPFAGSPFSDKFRIIRATRPT